MKRSPIPAAIVDAFTHTAGQGNRAGVVLEAQGLDEATMRAAARGVAASETAFELAPGQGVDVHLRYFTPATEVDFCGHATVATFHRLAETGRLASPPQNSSTNRAATSAPHSAETGSMPRSKR